MDPNPLAAPSLIETLLPLRAAEITLHFLAPTETPLFHQPALTAFLRALLDSPDHYDLCFALDAPESGRTAYRPGDGYRFAVFALPGGEDLLQQLLDQLRALPDAAPRREWALPFRDNLAFSSAHDLFQGHEVRAVAELTPYTLTALDREAALWRDAAFARLRWRSPVRLLRPKEARQDVKSEARYCHGPAEVSFALLADRLHDAFADLLRRRGVTPPLRGPAPAATLAGSDLFWVDCRYKDEQAREQVMGGLMGTLNLADLTAMPPDAWRLWVLGQYLGIGQRRAFGWGRYQLDTAEGDSTCVHSAPVTTLLERAAARDNLAAAYAVIRANARPEVRPPPLSAEDEWAWWSEELADAEAEAEDNPTDRLERLAAQLLTGRYQPPPLTGVVERERDGDLRALAIPPFFDRVAQRAVAQVLTPGLEPLMYHGSFGYRPRRSRHHARRMIEEAYQAGYRWVYESDIDDFFDSVDWGRLHNRLAALYGDDPLVALIGRWMAAPVRYENQLIQRSAGLPQGSPLSPLMANLLLDDFDSDLEHAGFRLVRFADDFVILAKDRAEAEAAAPATVQSLDELGLAVNPAKTGVRSFNQGFRYLGYLFVNGMALDVSGESEAPAGDVPPAPPPRSWLARLGRREPQALAADGRLPPAAVAKPSPGGSAPVRQVGEQAAAGTMLFVTGAPASLFTREGRLQVARDGEPVATAPWSGLQGIVLIGPHNITTAALRTALWQGVPVHFASQSGRYQGVAWNGQPGEEGYALWLEQAACFADPAKALAASRQVVEARLRHVREVLRQRAADGRFDDGLRQLDSSLRALAEADTLSALHGLEGQGARVFFDAARQLVPPEYGFAGRNRRPPRDPFNALLSLGYMILYAHVDTVLRASGLLPWVGFYHQSHGRHAILASDLMEPFRHLVERTALAVVTRRQLKPEDFYLDATEGCRLSQEARRQYLVWLAERFDTPLTALHSEQPKPLHGHLYDQNRALIAWIRGQAEAFVAWRMR